MHLGLADHLNHNYLRAITALLDDRAVRFGVIDVGTNSVKFHIGERAADGTWRAIVDRAEVTRLGEGQVGDGPIQGPAMERTADRHRGHGLRSTGGAGQGARSGGHRGHARRFEPGSRWSN